MELEALEKERRHWLTRAIHCLLGCYIQQDGVLYGYRYNVTHLRDVYKQ